MRKKRIICSLIVLILLFSSFMSPAVLASDEDNNNELNDRIKQGTTTQMLADRVSTVSLKTGESLSVSAVKEIHDFSDHLYYVIEFDPTGYLICNAEYGSIIEYSVSAPSPYLEESNDLFYGGPTYYYIENEGLYSHTFYNEELSFSDMTITSEWEQLSDEMYYQCSSYAEYYVDSLEEDITTINPLDISYTEPSSRATPTGTVTYVGSYYAGNKLKNLTNATQIGIYEPPNSNGICGYIASGLLLYWIDEGMFNDQFINDFSFIKSDHTGFINGYLAKELRSYGSSDQTSAGGTVGESLQDVLNEYASKHYLTINTTPHVGVSNDTIKSKLESTNKPVIVTGHLSNGGTNYQFHVVLAYGYTSTGEVVVHYGHPYYSEIVLNYNLAALGALGTYLLLNSYSSPALQFGDIPSSNWAYTAASYCARYRIIERLSDGKFYPSNQITRGAYVKGLYSLAGKPPVSGNFLSSYVDAPASTSSFYDAANWAVSEGILTGMTPTTLALDQTLTREQAITFLYRTSNVLGCSFADTSGPNANTFPDYGSVSNFAKPAMNWATTRYIVGGNHGYLYPKGILTRAESAQLIYRLSLYGSR